MLGQVVILNGIKKYYVLKYNVYHIKMESIKLLNKSNNKKINKKLQHIKTN